MLFYAVIASILCCFYAVLCCHSMSPRSNQNLLNQLRRWTGRQPIYSDYD